MCSIQNTLVWLSVCVCVWVQLSIGVSMSQGGIIDIVGSSSSQIRRRQTFCVQNSEPKRKSEIREKLAFRYHTVALTSAAHTRGHNKNMSKPDKSFYMKNDKHEAYHRYLCVKWQRKGDVDRQRKGRPACAHASNTHWTDTFNDSKCVYVRHTIVCFS